MKRNHRLAYDKLKALGAPVIEGGYFGEDTFRISGEHNEDRTWADYYRFDFGLFGVAPEVTNVLTEYKLFAEWVNPGVLGVYDA